MGAERITRRDPNRTTVPHMDGSIILEHGAVHRDVVAVTDIKGTSIISYRIIIGRLQHYCQLANASNIDHTNVQKNRSLLSVRTWVAVLLRKTQPVSRDDPPNPSSTRPLPPTRPRCLERCNPKSPKNWMDDNFSYS
jgi:hypothetical protein